MTISLYRRKRYTDTPAERQRAYRDRKAREAREANESKWWPGR